MTLPLTRHRQLKGHAGDGNRGLYWNKFFAFWPEDFGGKIAPGDKQKWICEFAAKTDTGEAAARLANLAKASGGDAKSFVASGPFVTGLGLSHPVENGFLFHHTLGVPYLPGSSVKGMIRAWASVWWGVEKGEQGYDAHVDHIWRLFGGPIDEEWLEDGKRRQKEIRPPSAGNIIVFDALPSGPIELMAEIVTPHDGGWRMADPTPANAPADWVSPNPIPFLAVKPGAKFQFALAPRKQSETAEDDLQAAWSYLERALEWIGAGAKTAIGFGRMMTKEREQEIAAEIKTAAAEQEKAFEEARTRRKAEWAPRPGDRVMYFGEERVISKLAAEPGDFYVSRLDGSHEMLSDASECEPIE